jgi:hypothetical protein
VTRKDWALLVIAAAAGQPVSPVQLQKALFLISMNLSPEQRQTAAFYNFAAYDYGPFDSMVYLDAEALERDGLVRIETTVSRYREYTATPAGLARAATLKTQLDPAVAAYLEQTASWVRSLSFNDLLRAIYTAYPAMKVNSVFQE